MKRIREKEISTSVENFLKALFHLQEGAEWVSTSALAERLEHRPASVTNRVQKLAAREVPLVEYRKYRGVRLTATGRRLALEVVRHHRLLELYLAEALGVPWDEVHAEAERLEHALSAEIAERMAAALPDTRRDPHGSPIPTRDGRLEVRATVPLAEVPDGARGRVAEVRDRDARLLRYLGGLGLVPGAALRVEGREAYGRSLRVRCGGRRITVGEEALAHVRVELEA